MNPTDTFKLGPFNNFLQRFKTCFQTITFAATFQYGAQTFNFLMEAPIFILYYLGFGRHKIFILRFI